MDSFMDALKEAWCDMLEPPWRHSGSHSIRKAHQSAWMLGWAWSISGMILGISKGDPNILVKKRES
jgi:hypothetical protein